LGHLLFLPLAFILGFGLGFSLLAFALGFLVWEAFGREKNCREIAEGKRMAKEGLKENLHQEL
jgi:hypothetical protein